MRVSYLPAIIGPLHRTSTTCHGGEATGARRREPYPCPRQGHGSAAPGHRHHGRTAGPSAPGGSAVPAPPPAPVALWIEQAPSTRLAAGSSRAGGATGSPPTGRAAPVAPALPSRTPMTPDPPGGLCELLTKLDAPLEGPEFTRRPTRRLGGAGGRRVAQGEQQLAHQVGQLLLFRPVQRAEQAFSVADMPLHRVVQQLEPLRGE